MRIKTLLQMLRENSTQNVFGLITYEMQLLDSLEHSHNNKITILLIIIQTDQSAIPTNKCFHQISVRESD